MRIQSGTQSLQMLKAQQALEARRAAKTQTTQPQVQQAKPAVEIARPSLPAEPQAAQGVSPQWAQKVNEIQNIAQKAGFVGVTEQDIRRAYVQGDSLLADYRV